MLVASVIGFTATPSPSQVTHPWTQIGADIDGENPSDLLGSSVPRAESERPRRLRCVDEEG